MPPPLDNQRCRERYEAAGYGQVMSCPHALQLRPNYGRAECYLTGDNKIVDGLHKWAIDSICYDKRIQAFTAEYDSQMRRYLPPYLAIQAMRKWAEAGLQRGYLERGDLVYAEWLLQHKCAAWPAAIAALKAREKELNNE